MKGSPLRRVQVPVRGLMKETANLRSSDEDRGEGNDRGLRMPAFAPSAGLTDRCFGGSVDLDEAQVAVSDLRCSVLAGHAAIDEAV